MMAVQVSFFFKFIFNTHLVTFGSSEYNKVDATDGGEIDREYGEWGLNVGHPDADALDYDTEVKYRKI